MKPVVEMWTSLMCLEPCVGIERGKGRGVDMRAVCQLYYNIF